MKEEKYEEFALEEEMLETTEEEVLTEEIEELSDDEKEDTTGGAFRRNNRCRGTFTEKTYLRTEMIFVGRAGLGIITKLTRISGPKTRWWINGVGTICITRTESKLGLGKYRAYGASGDWVDINLTFK